MARAKTSKKQASLGMTGQTDPRTPLDGVAFLKAAQPVLKQLGEDLLTRARASAAVTEALLARHTAERAARRTAEDFPGWQRQFVEQVAAAWLLSCVFVRTLEDRGLLGHARLAGPGASDAQRLFFEMAPSLTERDFLLFVFRELTRLPACRDLFDARHNPVWLLGPSAEGAKALLALFRQPSAEEPSFRFGQADTRFLGDLYQDLNEEVQKRYALLQTPRFVESFILDRTLDRALEKFGLDETTLIDPTCGSGHFLLGAFDRFFDMRLLQEPGLGERVAATKALAAVAGSDINPYAVAIAKFRLTLSFLEKAGFSRLKEAPALPLKVVVADSLLHRATSAGQLNFGEQKDQTAKAWGGDEFALEDEEAAREVLYRRYAAVVGNPPYIVVKDEVLRARYREMYVSASMQYSLGAPFTERFFQLAKDGGYVGMITANSFMKREFGKKLIQEFLPKVNVNLIVNTSGAYIPGHGTPTVLLFGTNEPPVGTDVLTVLANRGEPTTPERAEEGVVWKSIEDHWKEPGFESEYISVTRMERRSLAVHPWSLGGGGAAELKERLEAQSVKKLDAEIAAIGRTTVAGEDDIWIAAPGTWARLGLPHSAVTLVIGETVRDWSIANEYEILYPYQQLGGFPEESTHPLVRVLWPWRTPLENRTVFGKNMKMHGRKWWEHLEHYADRLRTPLSIAFPFVATHNHFVLDRGGKVFNRSAPIIKLPATATEDDHFALLAYLNSSAACFWMKQVCQPKHSAEHKTHPEPERNRYEFAGTAMLQLPMPRDMSSLREPAQLLDACASDRAQLGGNEAFAEALSSDESQTRAKLALLWQRFDALRETMVVLQEEIDWRVYVLFGLATTDLIAQSPLEDSTCPRGSRPFEQITPRKSFVRADDRLVDLSKAEVPPVGSLSPSLEECWQRRREALKQSPHLQMLEHPLFKRQWRDTDDNITEYEYRTRHDRHRASTYLLDVIETGIFQGASPAVTSEREVRSLLSKDPKRLVALTLTGSSLHELMHAESIPFLAAYRHTDTGLEKRAAWEKTWDLQREEDAGIKHKDPIPVPPKYDSTDFRDPNYWRHRGKLDVPKERFIAYPGCASDNDQEPVYGWAGWNHLQQAQALAALYQNRRTEEAWSKERLLPMLAGLQELLPWIKQWHNEPSEEYQDLRLGDYFETFLDAQRRELGLTAEDLTAFRPEGKKKGRSMGKGKKVGEEE